MNDCEPGAQVLPFGASPMTHAPDPWLAAAEGAARALPGVRADLTEFAALLEERAAKYGGLEALNPADLLLAVAALAKDPVATRELDRRLIAAVRSTLGRFKELSRDEIEQQVRQRVLVGEGTSKPKLAKYNGRGALVAWLKVVTTSLAIDETRKLNPERHADEDELVATASAEAGPETKALDAQHKRLFSTAFREALATLDPQERTVMRMRFVDNLAIEEIGSAFSVHRTTAMRWLERAQEKVMEKTRSLLAGKLGLKSREVDSLLRAVKPSFTDRLSRLLAAPPVGR